MTEREQVAEDELSTAAGPVVDTETAEQQYSGRPESHTDLTEHVAVVKANSVSPRKRADAAKMLHESLYGVIASLEQKSFESYLSIGTHLVALKNDELFKKVPGYSKKEWSDYIGDVGNRLGRTYSYYAMRLGQAEGLREFVDAISGVQAIEYAKLYSAKEIGDRIRATKDSIKGLSARETRKKLLELDPEKAPARSEASGERSIEDELASKYAQLLKEDEAAANAYLAALRRFVESKS